ncbi:MAG TPA: nucleotide exchange factor GrpE [Anaerolinea sp.]|nr:nucleotide exchange factor GrpE [Anaerolinea sp.]
MTDRKQKHPKEAAVPAEGAGAPEDEVVAGFREGEPSQPAESQPGGVSLEEYEVLKAELEEAQAKSKEYFDGWQRERADFSNYKRRVDREQATLGQNIAGEIIKKYLLVLDDLDRAMKFRPTQGEVSAWADGIELIYRKLQNILDAEGIKRIPAESEDFNPMRHEAISFEDSPEHTSGQIIGVVQEGYILGDRVLRPARVRVAR